VPRFVGPFKITKKRGEVAYQLELLPQLFDVHVGAHKTPVSCASLLSKCIK
jgi:hypothetical protein